LPNSDNSGIPNSGIPKGETARHVRRFLVIGVLSVLIDRGTYGLLLHAGLYVFLAKGISYVAGMVFGFFGNKFWTFQSPQKSAAEPIVYLIVYAITMCVNMAINALVLNCIKEQVGESMAREFAFLAATGVTTVLNFLGMRLLAFRAGIREHREMLRVENERTS
jgi:putative flippase GtrA